MNKDTDKMLRKGRLKGAYTSLPPDVQERVQKRCRQLMAENPTADKSLRQHVHAVILPAIALREILPKNGYAKGECLRLIRSSVLESAKPLQRAFSTVGRLPFFFPIFRVMCKKSMPAMYGEGGWVFRWKTNTKTAIEWDCTKCIYHDLFVQYGFRELTAIFCESDDVMYGSIPTARWGRTKTIGRGADICDFCFYKN